MKLNEFLTVTGLSMAGFAARVGSTAATISRMSSGKSVARRDLLVRIHEATNGTVCPNDLLGLYPPGADHASGLATHDHETPTAPNPVWETVLDAKDQKRAATGQTEKGSNDQSTK
jgi:hypothetical protein